MKLQDVLYDGESQTRSGDSALVRLIHLVISLPDIVYLVLRNSLSRVRNLYPHVIREDFLPDCNHLVITCIIYCVVYKVINDLIYLVLISIHKDSAIALEAYPVAILLL